MKEYRFTVGNARWDEVALSFSIQAESKEEAIEIANNFIEQAETYGQVVEFQGPAIDPFLGFGSEITLTEEDIENVYEPTT